MATVLEHSNESIDPRQTKSNAESIIEELKQYADKAESSRRLPTESIALIKSLGLNRIVQSKASGGYELPMRSHVDVVSAVAEGCGATAWVLGVYHAHSWMLTHFPANAQQDVYGDNPDALVSAVIGPRGNAAQQADDTFVLNGFWPFGSGCEHSDWLILGAAIVDAEGNKIDEGDLLVPTAEVTIKDDWYVAGLQGTGSNSLVAEDVRVPAHRYLSLPKLINRQSPAYDADVAGSVNKAQAVPVLAVCLVAGSLGIARAALAEFKRLVPGKRIQYTPHVADEWSPLQVTLGAAASKIHAAELVLYRIADDIDEYATRGEEMPLELRARLRMDCALVVRMLLEAVDELFLNAGASALSLKNTLQRASRDLHATNMHGLLFFNTNAELYGRVLLDKEPNTPII